MDHRADIMSSVSFQHRAGEGVQPAVLGKSLFSSIQKQNVSGELCQTLAFLLQKRDVDTLKWVKQGATKIERALEPIVYKKILEQ